MDDLNQIPSPAKSPVPLRRGRACVNCRRRKIKCDGGRPMCGQCTRDESAFEDCEYVEEGLTKAQTLEQQISILQGRIHKLENRKQSTTIQLTQPFQIATPSGSSPSSSRITPANAMDIGPLLNHFYLQQTSGTLIDEATSSSMPTDLPFIVLQALVHNFLHSAPCLGIFLDTKAFHDAIMGASTSAALVAAPSSTPTLPPVLLNVLYLWGVRLSQDTGLAAYEPALLAHALRSTASSLEGTHPRTMLYSLQASILLAYYFIHNGRLLEGRYHTSAAVGIALSLQLHRIRSPLVTAQINDPAGGSAASRSADAATLREEGERIMAFWRVMHLNNFWAGVDVAAVSVSYGEDGLAIDTPWPLDIPDYEERPHLLPAVSSATVNQFLMGVPDTATSIQALHSKASILFEMAARIGARVTESSLPADLLDAFIAFDLKIASFIQALPPIHSKRAFVAHMLAHGAMIQLHKRKLLLGGGTQQSQYEHNLDQTADVSRENSLAAARAIVSILLQMNLQELRPINPGLAVLWTSVSFVFIAEISRIRQFSHHSDTSTEWEELHTSLNSIISVMEFFEPHFPFMHMQLETVKQAYVV